MTIMSLMCIMRHARSSLLLFIYVAVYFRYLTLFVSPGLFFYSFISVIVSCSQLLWSWILNEYIGRSFIILGWCFWKTRRHYLGFSNAEKLYKKPRRPERIRIEYLPIISLIYWSWWSIEGNFAKFKSMTNLVSNSKRHLIFLFFFIPLPVLLFRKLQQNFHFPFVYLPTLKNKYFSTVIRRLV